ncbi:TPA: FAD-binding protein [Pseudomonas aeruginosa]
MKKRWIQMDVTRGVGILIIVFGHSWFVASSPTVLYPLLSPFILPLFFFISGVFFRTEQPFGEMALRKADALLKPFFVTMLGYVILRDLLRGQPLLPDIGGVLYASVDTLPWQALWYLPHFWVATLFAWFMLRVIQRLGLSLAASCVLLAVQLGLGILFLKTFWQIPVEFGGEQYLLPGLPFSLDITLISSAHFMFGYVLRDVLRRHQSSLLTLCIALAVTTASFLYYPTVVDMAQRRYDHWFWATVQAVSGVYLCWALSGLMMKIDWLGKAMTYIGQSTLILLIFHGEIQHKTFNLLAHLGLSEPAAASVALVISVIVSLLIGEVIKRVALLRALYFPFPVRKKAAAVQGGGGFPHDPQRRAELAPTLDTLLPLPPPGCNGDGLRLGESAGGRVADDLRSPIAWAPVSRVPHGDGETGHFPHIIERGKPGLIGVLANGRRFVNEAHGYHDYVAALLEATPPGQPARSWLVCDRRFLRRYGLGYVRPAPLPIAAHLRSGYLKRGTSLDQLARSCGIDPSGLAATVAEYNRHAREGRDPEFGRGGTAFNRKQGDPAYPGPNPCVAPIERGPYYAVQVEPGCFGTFAGLKTDAQARVLDGGGQPIPGLYAAGADMASLFAGHYPSGGINLGPALTFGYIAGRHIAGALGYEQEQAQRG